MRQPAEGVRIADMGIDVDFRAVTTDRNLLDRLTGLPNRDAFVSELETAVNNREPLAVVVIDLNRFKVINDTLGHRAGDALLVEVANRLRNAVNERSFVARLGGDEFAIIMRPTNGPPTFERALARAQLTAEAICVEPAMIGGAKVPVEAAFGLALLEPHQDPLSVLSRADMAMYAAKRSGALIRMFTPDMEQDNARDLILTTELDAALTAGDIIAHLQPKVSIDTLAIIGVEVLARWNHPVFGVLQPDAFVHLIELSGRIGKLTARMIALGLDAATEARRHGHDLAVAVNVPARALLDGGFVTNIIAQCVERDLPPSILTIELTEGELMDSAGLGSAVLCDLADAGVRLSIDDFGTGYSSFARLVDLPISEVKIDKSFVQGLDLRTNQVIVRTIVEMGRSLGYQIVAEGVETDAQLDFLRGLGTELSAAQGFAFGRPQPIEALIARLAPVVAAS